VVFVCFFLSGEGGGEGRGCSGAGGGFFSLGLRTDRGWVARKVGEGEVFKFFLRLFSWGILENGKGFGGGERGWGWVAGGGVGGGGGGTGWRGEALGAFFLIGGESYGGVGVWGGGHGGSLGWGWGRCGEGVVLGVGG